MDYITQNPWDSHRWAVLHQLRLPGLSLHLPHPGVLQSVQHADYCRYNLNAIPWSTRDVGNTTVILQDSVPQLGFTGTDVRQNMTTTHYMFHVPQNFTNVSVQATMLQPGYVLMGLSRWGFPSEDIPSEWRPSTLTREFNPTIYFDWTSPVFRNPGPVGMTQSGAYFLTVWADRPSVYSLTLNLVDPYNRYNNRSAIIAVDALRQAGHLYRDQHRILYTFIAPRVNATKGQVAKAVTIQVTSDDDLAGPPDLFVTTNGSIPHPGNAVFTHTAEDIDSAITILPGRPGSCDTRVQDCVYTVAAYKSGWFYNDSRAPREQAFVLTASNGQAFIQIEDGQKITGVARNGDPRLYTFELQRRADDDNYDLTVTVVPSRLFCNAIAFVARETFPDLTNPYTLRTNYTQGVRTIHLRRAPPGTYVVVVVADQYDNDCRFEMTVTSDLVRLDNGAPFADYLLGANASYSRNDSWRWYRFSGFSPRDQVVFQVTPLSSDSRLNFYVKYEERNPNLPWVWNSTWDAVTGAPDVLVIRPNDTNHRDDADTFFVAVECVSYLRPCTYEVVAETGYGTRLLRDGQQIRYPLQLDVGEWAFFRAFALPSAEYRSDLTITVGRVIGAVSVFASLDPHQRYPGFRNNSEYNTTMDNLFDAAFLIVPFADLVRPDVDRNGYIYIAVRGDGPSKSEFTITSSLIATFLTDGYETLGWCDRGRDALFIFNLDDIHPVQLMLTGLYSRSGAQSVQLYVDDRNNVTANGLHLWQWERWMVNSSLLLSQRDQQLRDCVASRAGCTLFLNVTGCTEFTVFTLVAQIGDRPQLLTDDDARDVTVDNGAQSYYRERRFFDIGVSAPAQLGIYVETCVGGVESFLNSPLTSFDYPTNTSFDQHMYGDQLQAFTLSTRELLPNSYYKVTVEAQEPGINRFRIVSSTRSNATLPALRTPASFQATAGDESVTVSFDYRLQTATGPVRYELYTVPDPAHNNAALYTRCGVQLPNVSAVVVWSEEQVRAAAAANTFRTTVTLGSAQYKFVNGQTYRFGLQVAYTTAPGYTSYLTMPEVVPAGSSGGESKAAEDAGAIILGVVLPITLILAAVALVLYIRNKKLQQELSVELPDVSATPSSAAARRRAQRGPEVQGDAFSRGGGDMYNSLLGEEENGGEDGGKRRAARAAARKAAAPANGGSARADPEDSETPYRSDVI